MIGEIYRLLFPHIMALALAIAQIEGYGEPGSRATRNNNPGNLRYSRIAHSRDAGGFARFRTDDAGWYALMLDIQLKAQGKTRTGLGPSSTIRDFIWVWAPPHENDTRRYVEWVRSRGFHPDLRLEQLLGRGDEHVWVVD